MRRREFITGLGGAAAWPLVASAQQTGKIAKIGFIEAGSQQANQIFLDSFNDGLKALGWFEGKNISVLDRWVEARSERLPEIINGLLQSGVDVLVTGAGPASIAAKQATSTIPIVGVGIPDPIGLGLINSLVRPGGNFTGFSSLSVELTAKRVQLLQEALPRASRIAVFLNPKDSGSRTTSIESNDRPSFSAAPFASPSPRPDARRPRRRGDRVKRRASSRCLEGCRCSRR